MRIWSQVLIDNLLFHPTPQSKRYFYSNFSVQDLLIVLTEHCFFSAASGTTKLHDIEALCQPHLTVISLDHSRPGLLRPLYIKLHRCAGSCTSPHLHCTLKTQEEVKIPVTDLLGKQAVVRTTNHTSCDCACAIVPDQCLQSEQWSEAHCRCLATRRNLVSMIRGIGYNIMK